MRSDETRETDRDTLIDLGAATELTQGTFMPTATEAVVFKDYFDQP